MASLLIAYDGSEPARRAFAAAGRLFPAAVARVVVVDHDFGASGEARSVAAEGAALARQAGLDAQPSVTVTTTGVWPRLLAAARQGTADVLVCGTRGRGGLGRALLGSTSSSLVHEADLPLLIVPEMERAGDGPALLAYDGSDAARNAILAAGRLLERRSAVVLHAWEWPLSDSLTERALTSTRFEEVEEIIRMFRDAAEEEAQAVADEGCEVARAQGFEATARAVEACDGVWQELLGAAAAADAAVLVTGSRGRGGVTSTLLGSVSATLAHHAQRPTLVVRPAS